LANAVLKGFSVLCSVGIRGGKPDADGKRQLNAPIKKLFGNSLSPSASELAMLIARSIISAESSLLPKFGLPVDDARCCRNRQEGMSG